MDNIKYLLKNKGKIFVSLFTLIIYVSAFVFFLSYYYSEKNRLDKSISLPENYIYVIDNDTTSSNRYETLIKNRFPEGVVSSYAIEKEYLDGHVVKIIGIDDYVMDTGIFINDNLYPIDKKELKDKEVIVSSLMTSLVDDSIKFNEENFLIVGSFDCDDYVILMDIDSFISYITDIRITIDGDSRNAYQYHLVKLSESPTIDDIRIIWRLYDYRDESIAEQKAYTKEIYIKKELDNKMLNESLINLLFWLSILCCIFSMISWGHIYFRKRRDYFLITRKNGKTNMKIRGIILVNSVALGLICSIFGILSGTLIYAVFTPVLKCNVVLIPFSYYVLIIIAIVGLLALVGQIMFLFEGKKLNKLVKQEN